MGKSLIRRSQESAKKQAESVRQWQRQIKRRP